MNRMRLSGIAAWALGLLLLIGGAVRAEDAKSAGGEGGQAEKQKSLLDPGVEKELGITDDQDKNIKQLLYDLGKANETAKAHIVLLNNDFEALVKDDKSDSTKIKAVLEEAAKIQIDDRMLDIETAEKINKILTPQQLAAWRDMQTKAQGSIFGYKKELNLQPDQVKDIQDQIEQLGQALYGYRLQLTTMNNDLQNLLKVPEPDLNAVRNKLTDATKLQSEMRYADIVTARNINKVLSEDQLKVWRKIQEDLRKKK